VADPSRLPAVDLLSAIDNNADVSPDDRLQGTLDLLILRTLAEAPSHGWAISRRIRERSGEVLQVNQGSRYPALHRLEKEGWLAADWTVADTGRRAKVYRLTAHGRRGLEREERGWLAFVAAVTQVLLPA
jgi:PadR family transcriptional regulator, regulatory protein PadR